MTALRYTKPWVSSTTSAFGDTERNKAVTLEEKEEMVGKTAFPHPPADPVVPPSHHSHREHQRVNECTVPRVLFVQSQRKAPGQYRLKFEAL